MLTNEFKRKDFWRAIILYGRNTATYKIALGLCLSQFAKHGKSNVTMTELAKDFFDIYLERLKNGKPQLNEPGRRSTMEKVVDLYQGGILSRTEAIERVENEAFGDVIPRFHTVGPQSLPVNFYEKTNSGLVLTDSLFEVFTNDEAGNLVLELGSRWDLLEAAFEMRGQDTALVNDIRRFYLLKGYDRTNITENRPVLNGYQNDVCFYCGELMAEDDVHVDHVIPRQFIQHDDIWNLVLAHEFCNEQKLDALPGPEYIEKLIERNEHFIISNHPIKQKLIAQLGLTEQSRRAYVQRVYDDAKIVIGYTWEGIRGYNPGTDVFYKTFIRSLTNRG